MSRPSKTIVPAVGVSCSRISLEVVVLPQPDSPMRPSVSPSWMTKSTPSTALTHAPVRPSSPRRVGKCFVRPRTSRMGLAIEPAPGDAPGLEVEITRLLGRAARQDLGAARVEGTPARQAGQVGRRAGDGVERLL